MDLLNVVSCNSYMLIYQFPLDKCNHCNADKSYHFFNSFLEHIKKRKKKKKAKIIYPLKKMQINSQTPRLLSTFLRHQLLDN